MSLKSELLDMLDDVRKHLHASDLVAVAERNRVDDAIGSACSAAGSMVVSDEPAEVTEPVQDPAPAVEPDAKGPKSRKMTAESPEA